jgi:hypothetical protein
MPHRQSTPAAPATQETNAGRTFDAVPAQEETHRHIGSEGPDEEITYRIGTLPHATAYQIPNPDNTDKAIVVAPLVMGILTDGISLTSAAVEAPTLAEGSFSIIDWRGYPEGMPRPTGPMRVISGEEYKAAREATNAANATIRAGNGLEGSGYDIHEIQPVQFGGSPTDMANKMLLSQPEHTGPFGVHEQFWKPLLRWVRGG